MQSNELKTSLRKTIIAFSLTILFITGTVQTNAGAIVRKNGGATVSLQSSEIAGFSKFPPHIRNVIIYALTIAAQGFPYAFSKESPEEGGFDCSGAIYHALRAGGLRDTPRTAAAQYSWVWRNSQIHPVVSIKSNSFEFQRLRPGDLLFWTGTYKVKRDPPISHVMMYIGKLRADGRQLMIGSTERRRYRGVQLNGFSVYDFTLPKANSDGYLKSRFVAYGTIPGIEKYQLPNLQPIKQHVPNSGNYYQNFMRRIFRFPNSKLHYPTYSPSSPEEYRRGNALQFSPRQQDMLLSFPAFSRG